MRRFSAEYLEDTRRGLWADRSALVSLDLPGRRRVLDVGCGTGAFASVLAEESGAEVICLDADPRLLAEVHAGEPVLGDATRLPIADQAVDLAACQALLVNLEDPGAAVRELCRVSAELVAAVEPDNSAVSVESTVPAESALAENARRAYLAGLETDASLGSRAAELFEAAGLREVTTARHELVRETVPPYDGADVESARRKAAGSRLAEQQAELRAGGITAKEYEALLADWRAMGRSVVDQMRAGEYRRTERVPFYVTVGRV